jgi:hypothetical protein
VQQPAGSIVIRQGAGNGHAAGSTAVREVQRRLVALGYRPGAIDGAFGPRTRSAVAWFQIKHRLAPTGAVDRQTLILLRYRTHGLPRVAAPTAAPAKTPAPTPDAAPSAPLPRPDAAAQVRTAAPRPDAAPVPGAKHQPAGAPHPDAAPGAAVAPNPDHGGSRNFIVWILAALAIQLVILALVRNWPLIRPHLPDREQLVAHRTRLSERMARLRGGLKRLRGHFSRLVKRIPSPARLRERIPPLPRIRVPKPDLAKLRARKPDVAKLRGRMPDASKLRGWMPDVAGLRAHKPDLAKLRGRMPDASKLRARVPQRSQFVALAHKPVRMAAGLVPARRRLNRSQPQRVPARSAAARRGRPSRAVAVPTRTLTPNAATPILAPAAAPAGATAPRRVIGYAVGRNHDEFARQQRAIERICGERGWTLAALVKEPNRRQSKQRHRPGLTHVLREVAGGTVAQLIVGRLHSVARSPEELAALLDGCRRYDVGLVALDVGLDTTTPDGRLAARCLGAVAAAPARTQRTGNGNGNGNPNGNGNTNGHNGSAANGHNGVANGTNRPANGTNGTANGTNGTANRTNDSANADNGSSGSGDDNGADRASGVG